MSFRSSSVCMALFAFVVIASAAPHTGIEVPEKKPQYDLDDAPKLFEKFIKDFNRNYKDEADKNVHYEAFFETLKTVNKLNSDPAQTAWFDINDFADYTKEQRSQMFGLRLPSEKQ